MSSKKSSNSPYKALLQKNNNYCAYARMPDLEPNKSYRMYDLKHTVHTQFGDGELAFINDSKGGKLKVQLPSKYLKSLTAEQIQVYYDDIKEKKFPFLVYRKTLKDGSFLIDIYPHIEPLISIHQKWDDVPPNEELDLNLDSSIESNDANQKDNDNSTDNASEPCPKKAKIDS